MEWGESGRVDSEGELCWAVAILAGISHTHTIQIPAYGRGTY